MKFESKRPEEECYEKFVRARAIRLFVFWKKL